MPALTCALKGWVAKPRLMKMNHCVALVCLLLAACSQDPSGIRLIQEKQAAADAGVTLKAKTEPVFYNGKTYQVSLAPEGNGHTTVKIADMGPKQAKDASALATSALFHFACKDSQKAELAAPPAFDGTAWSATGTCN